jgi:hypothetical protein
MLLVDDAADDGSVKSAKPSALTLPTSTRVSSAFGSALRA